jgi:L-ascorbate metabolism protein UlaG (beta-lactamase superfamily)
MRLSWLGHSAFRIEIEDQIILLDPWIGNPLFEPARRQEALDGATHVLLTHGRGDHAQDAVAIAKELDIPVVGIFDLMAYWGQ